MEFAVPCFYSVRIFTFGENSHDSTSTVGRWLAAAENEQYSQKVTKSHPRGWLSSLFLCNFKSQFCKMGSYFGKVIRFEQGFVFLIFEYKVS